METLSQDPAADATTEGRPAVVVVGGGFAGLYAVRRLASAPVDVVVIDDTGVHLFQPLLYQCATGLLSEGQITAPLRRLFRRHANVETVLARVTGLDPVSRTVSATRPDGTTLTLRYDFAILATGVEQSYFGHDEFAVHAPGMKSIDDALTIRRRVLGAFEMAETLPTAEERRPWLTFALVGAGPTGVELAGQIRELATHTLDREFRTIDPAEATVLLFDGGEEPLASFGSVLAKGAGRTLRELGVELRLGTRVTKVDAEGLEFRRHGEDATQRVDARTVLWTAGVAAPALATAVAKATGAQQDDVGRLVVQPDLTIPGHPTIYVTGDVMSLNKLPGVAEVAMQAGLHAAGQIHRTVAGKPAGRRFRYRDLGSAAYISRGQAVVKVGPIKLSGRPGWLVWGLIHITFLTGYRNRAGAVLSWLTTLSLGTRRELVFPRRDLDSGQKSFVPPERPAA